MIDARRALPRLARTTVVAVGLSFLPAQLLAQEVDFDLLWSHDTGG